MTWGAVAGAAIGVVGSAMSSDGGSSGGGAGASTASKDPWMAAQPWMRSNIAQGQNLQGQYQRAPFNEAQLRAYGNMGAQSDYMRQLVPGLLGTASRQQLGWDRSNPDARPEAYRFDASGPSGGLLGSLTGQALANYGAANPTPQAPQMQQGRRGTFTNQISDPANERGMSYFRGNTGLTHGENSALFGQGMSPDSPAVFNGGFGEFKYGMDIPEPGTEAYRDMMEYFQYGGADPYGIYQMSTGKPTMWGGLLHGGNGGPGAGGIGAAGGAGAGSAAGGPGW